MEYFLDTEFNEDGNSNRPTIELISIALVDINGREYYAESNEFDESKCNSFVKANVLPRLGPKEERKSRLTIRTEIELFIKEGFALDKSRLEIWADHASYDWVVFCWLWGAMVDLPTYMPMHPMDLQQWWLQLGRPKTKTLELDPHHALSDARYNKGFFEDLLLSAATGDTRGQR